MPSTKHILITLFCFFLALELLIGPINCESSCETDGNFAEVTERMSEVKPTVRELLSKSSSQITEYLAGIYEHSPWVAEGLVAKSDALGTISTVSGLATSMKAVVEEASRDQKLNLLLSHPDLCEKVAKMADLTKESQEEQASAGLQSLTDTELERFTSANSNYREKFGFPFILAVRNASKFTVLSALEGRLPNSPEKELAVSLEQVHKIAWMRLLSKLNTDDAQGFLTCHVLDTANGIPGKENSSHCIY